ncbi:MAG: 3-oxoacyl-ACP synthase, partial [Planctomycetes bacterium]|nr:3-oxoacyl-ACP synthase [Planctomycetota bacterium]
TYDCVLVVGVEKLSAIVDYRNRETCVLFGDGAGATVFTSYERAGRARYLGGSTRMSGAQEDVLMVPAGGSRNPASHDTVEQRRHFIHMGGKRVYRFAVKTLAELVQKSVEPYGYDELGLVVPHQVNLRIIESAAERIDLPMEKVFTNIQSYGNTSAASVPLALDEAFRAGLLESGKLICMPAFGAGMAWGHVLLRW